MNRIYCVLCDLKQSARKNISLSADSMVYTCHEEPTLRDFFTRKYLLELDYFSCVCSLDNILHAYGLSKNLE